MSAPGMLPALRVLLGATDDAACLLAELGGGAAPEHLRYKPGRSVVGRLSGGSGRWIAGFSPAAADKAQNLRARAAACGIQLAERPVPGAPGHVLMSGPAGLDGRVRRPLTAERLVDAAGRPVGRVLNYNPWRRLVQAVGNGAVPRFGDAPHPAGQGDAAAPGARSAPGPQDGPDGTPCGTWVAKTASTGQGDAEARLRQLAAAGVPVLVPRGGADRRTLYYPFYGSGDLAGTVPEPEALGEAAGILARLHAHAAHHGLDRTVDPLRRLDPVVAAISRLVPRLAPEVRSTADSLLAAAGTATARTPVLLHGDFSADQLLAGPAGLRLIDLDRIAHGPAEWDLGSFAAAELAAGRGPEHAEALLAAYRSAIPGSSRDASEVRPWTGIHLLLRALEPFRAADPHWEDAIAARIRLAAAAGLR